MIQMKSNVAFTKRLMGLLDGTEFPKLRIDEIMEQFVVGEIDLGYWKCDEIYTLCTNQEALENTSVTDFQELFTLQNNNF